MKNFTREELSKMLNEAPLTDASKKTIAKALRYRNKTTLLSRLGIGMGLLLIFGGLNAITHSTDRQWIFIQTLYGLIFGAWFITSSLSSLREIKAAKAIEELIIITANQRMDPTSTNAQSVVPEG